ncbi:hypothetical protein DL95DRAFT_468127 [Leptodontidium sp. 2 PMI_412]|nr:hypothetical protein DL95DRAFT_468127 [Leptodontidium sp. 2 PMI_412]
MPAMQSGSHVQIEGLSQETRKAIVETFFGTPPGTVDLQALTGYLSYYETEWRRLRIGISSPSWEISNLAVKVHEDILHVCRTLSAGRDKPRSELRQQLKGYFRTANDIAID